MKKVRIYLCPRSLLNLREALSMIRRLLKSALLAVMSIIRGRIVTKQQAGSAQRSALGRAGGLQLAGRTDPAPCQGARPPILLSAYSFARSLMLFE